MTTREKIIVGLMLLTVGYGAIELFVPRAPVGPVTAQPGQSAEGLNTFIAKVADAVKTDTTGTGDVLIKKAEADWKQNPLLAIRKAAPKVEEKPTVKEAGRPSLPNLTYSGFLEIGAKRLAIINGMEYEAGDRLVSGGLTVKSVLPNKVIMTSSQGEIVLPLQESE